MIGARLLTIDQKCFHSRNGKIAWIKIRIAAPSVLFSWFGPLWLFSILKSQDLAQGKEIFIQWGVIVAIDAYFENLETSYFSEGIKKLEHCWTKYVELQGDYVKK